MLLAFLVCISAFGLVAATWVGYPMVMIARLRRRDSPPVADPAWRPTATVVLATREPTDAIVARVHDLLASDYPADRLDVVIGLEPSAADSERLATLAALPRTRVVVGDAPGGKAANLNAAVRAATGDVLLFADTYQRFDRETVGTLVAALADARFGAVSGSLVLPGEGSSTISLVERYWRLERRLREAEGRTASTIGVTGAVYALRRQLWSPLPGGLILDDLYVPMRVVLAGHRVGFLPDAIAREARAAATGHEYGRKVRTLTGNLQLCAWLPDVLSPIRNPAWSRFIWHKLMRLATPYLLMIGAAAAAAVVLLALPTHRLALFVAAAVVALIVLWAPVGPLRRVRDAIRWGVVLQAAVVTATIRGLRGQWDVWT